MCIAGKQLRVTVLLPVYNAESHIGQSVKSVLFQTYENFELIVINDGSTDKTADILRSFEDARMRVVDNPGNLGLIQTLNRGLAMARGEYIARMDADDICTPERLKIQVGYMDAHPAIGACGMWMRNFGEGVAASIVRFPVSPQEIQCSLLGFSSLGHPTVMLRRNMFEKYDLRYDESFIHAEDYDLWERASRYFSIANIPEIGLHYRLHGAQISGLNRKKQKETRRRIWRRQLHRLIPDLAEKEIEIHDLAVDPDRLVDHTSLLSAENWLLSLFEANNNRSLYDQDAMNKFLADRWLNLCNRTEPWGRFVWIRYRRSKLRNPWRAGRHAEGKMLIKSILGERGRRFAGKLKINWTS